MNYYHWNLIIPNIIVTLVISVAQNHILQYTESTLYLLVIVYVFEMSEGIYVFEMSEGI